MLNRTSAIPPVACLLGWLACGVASSLAGTEATLARAAPAGEFKWGPFLAPFHSVLLHYPIGFVTVAVILEALCFFRRDEAVKRLNRLILHLCLLSTVVVIILGLLRASDGGYEPQTLDTHRTYGIAVGVLLALTWVAQRFTLSPQPKRAAEAGYRVLLAGTLGVLVVAGHAGGNLTHGSKYLVKNAPQFVRDLLEDAPDPPAPAAAVMDEQTRLYVEKIEPLFEAKCLECHGAEKQKGGYRLDQREVALKGGESGATAIKPGDPMASNLIRLILLPREHDDAMPPAGKTALTPDEVLTIVQWIQEGARFPDAMASAVAEPAPETTATNAPQAGAVAVAATGGAPAAAADSPSPGPGGSSKVNFAAQIQPILEQHCVNCHGPEKQKGKLRLDSRASALKGGSDAGPGIVPGKAGESAVVKRLLIDPAKDANEELMPPANKGGPLDKPQIELVQRWIDEGADWPNDVMLQARAATAPSGPRQTGP